MANTLRLEQKAEIKSLYMTCRNIRLVARSLSVSRNTVRRLLRDDGLTLIAPTKREVPISTSKLAEIDFSFLKRIFDLSEGSPDSAAFEALVTRLSSQLKSEIGIETTADQLRLELAMSQFILFRRYFMRSLQCSDKSYSGTFTRSHDKLALAIDRWTMASHRALEVCVRLIRELEVRYGKAIPEMKSGNIHVTQNNLTVG